MFSGCVEQDRAQEIGRRIAMLDDLISKTKMVFSTRTLLVNRLEVGYKRFGGDQD